MQNEIEKLPDGTYVFLWGFLMKNTGGMTRVALKRVCQFAAQDARVKFLLSSRNKEQLDAVEHFRQIGYTNLTEDMFVTIEDYLGGRLSIQGNVHEPGMCRSIIHGGGYKEATGKATRFYRDGRLFAAETEQDIRRKRHIDFYDAVERKIQEETLWDGRLCRILKYKSDTERVIYYYSDSGFCYMRVEEKFDGQWKAGNVKLFSERTMEMMSFTSYDDLRRYFFLEYIKELSDKNIFVMHDPLLDFDAGLKNMQLAGKNIYRIGIVHNVGIWDNRNWYDRLNPRLHDAVESKMTPDVDGLIILTEEQLADYKKRLGNTNIFYKIPNTIHIPERIPDFSNRDLNRVVYIGRFDEKQKQLSHIVRAWAKVERTVPDAHLHFYGRGADEEKIRQIVRENGLSTIFIEPFTNDVGSVYQTAALSVTASAYEGFSLSLLESFANGCPNVTYNFKYGPQDLIEHGKNGLIVEQGNTDALADALISLLQKPSKIKSMSREARKRIMMYSEDKHLRTWIETLNSIVRNKKLATRLDKAEFSLVSCALNRETGNIALKGELVIQGQIPEVARGMERIYVRCYNAEKTDYSVIDISYSRTRELCYEITAQIPSDVKDADICIEWNNSFAKIPVDLNRSTTECSPAFTK